MDSERTAGLDFEWFGGSRIALSIEISLIANQSFEAADATLAAGPPTDVARAASVAPLDPLAFAPLRKHVDSSGDCHGS